MAPEPDVLLPRCPNCGEARTGPYCSGCGQAQRVRKRAVWMIVADFLAHSFAYDSRFWRTLIPLLSRPGAVTAENLRGRWVSYLPPLRVYLVASLVFVLTLSWRVPIDFGDSFRVTSEGNVILGDGAQAGAPAFNGERAMRPFPDTWLATRWLNDRIEPHLDRLNSLPPGEASQAYENALTRTIPTVVLLALPLFALGLKLLWLFQRRWYFEHFIFAAHFYSVWLISATVGLLIAQPWYWWLSHALYLPVWLFLALRRVYRQHWFWIGTKLGALGLWQLFSAALLTATLFFSAIFRV